MKKLPKNLPPRRLLPGDKIGIASPSGPVDKDAVSDGAALLESAGFQVCIDERVFARTGYLAGTDKERAARLTELFLDTELKAILCARGGYGAMRILPHMDYDIIRNNPKIIMGFSDVTALLCALYSMCGLITFHGPMITTVGTSSDRSVLSMIGLLTENKPYRISSDTAETVRSGRASGVVIGGNLTTLCHLVGTPYCPDFQGRILVIEDRGEACYRIDRMLTQMMLAGCFKSLKGLILGAFEDCGSVSDIAALTDNLFESHHIPIIAGFQIGHGKENISFPIGIEGTLDADQKILYFQSPAVI